MITKKRELKAYKSISVIGIKNKKRVIVKFELENNFCFSLEEAKKWFAQKGIKFIKLLEGKEYKIPKNINAQFIDLLAKRMN